MTSNNLTEDVCEVGSMLADYCEKSQLNPISTSLAMLHMGIGILKTITGPEALTEMLKDMVERTPTIPEMAESFKVH